MKKLAALASMAVLLCASASFAKKAMDEQEMDLVTAAGQPTVVDIKVEQDGTDELTSTTSSETRVETTADGAQTTPATNNAGAVVGVGFEANAALGELEVANGINVELEDVALQLDAAVAAIIAPAQSVDPAAGSTATATIVATASSTSTIDAGDVTVAAGTTDASVTTLIVESESQSTLRAITLNNVVGENQLATAVNIASNAFNAGGSQSNEINQSWGASYDWSFAPGGGVAADGGDGGDINQGPNSFVNNPCVLNVGDCGSDLSGGDAAAETFDNTPLTISADQIVKVDVESQGDATVTAVMTDVSVTTVTIESLSQVDLAALTVNNVAGKNQVANGLNITSAGPVVIGGGGGQALVVLSTQAVGGATSFTTAQSNAINQYRGTPLSQ